MDAEEVITQQLQTIMNHHKKLSRYKRLLRTTEQSYHVLHTSRLQTRKIVNNITSSYFAGYNDISSERD